MSHLQYYVTSYSEPLRCQLLPEKSDEEKFLNFIFYIGAKTKCYAIDAKKNTECEKIFHG